MAKTRPSGTPRTGEALDPTENDITKRWWNAIKSQEGQVAEVGQLVYQELAAIERSQGRQRYMNYVAAMLMEGQAPASFAFSMSSANSREAQAMSNAAFRPPSLNVCAVIGDTLKERVWSRVSWLEFLPVSKADYDSRERATQSNQWLDAYLDDTDFEGMISACGQDAATYGTSIVKTMPSRDGKTVVNTRLLIDEIRVSTDADYKSPRSIGQVTFESRDELIRVYAKGRHADVIKKAIQNAPAVNKGFMALATQYSEVIGLAEAFRFDQDKEGNDTGRHVLTLADGFTLVDEEWTHGNPYSVLRYNRLSRSFTGKGVPQNVLSLQLELDRICACRAELQRQMSFPHAQVERSSHVDLNSLDPGSVIEYSGTPVKFDVVSGTPADLSASIRELELKILQREGISPGTAGGDIDPGIKSGVAIEATLKIADGRLYSHAKNLEQFIEEIGKKVIRMATVVEPQVLVNGKQMSWTSVKQDLKTAKLRAFPVSKLPSTLPGQIETIDRWSQNGDIDSKQRSRLLALPDPTGTLPYIASSENLENKILNKILKDKRYHAPDQNVDPVAAYGQAKAFYCVERCNETPEPVLILLQKHIDALEALVKAATPPPAPPPGPGAPPPAGP